MAEVSAVNYAKTQELPSQKIENGELNGHIKCLYDSYTFSADAFAADDEINLGGKLPKGAKILEAAILSPSLGTTGIFQLGARSNEGSISSDDPDYLIASADAGGQAVNAKMPAGAAGAGVSLDAETQLYSKCTEITTAADGLQIQFFVWFIES